MENKMTVSANYAMRHPSCPCGHPTQPFFSKQHASSKHPFSIEQAANILNSVSLRFIPHKKLQFAAWRRPLMVRQPYSEAV